VVVLLFHNGVMIHKIAMIKQESIVKVIKDIYRWGFKKQCPVNISALM
jgi:hypothetical protein